jgi:DNA-binding XRE family transcriptional regulator
LNWLPGVLDEQVRSRQDNGKWKILASLLGVRLIADPCLPNPPDSRTKYTWKIDCTSTRKILGVIGKEIRKARLEAGLSQEELAFRAKVARNYISLVELNHHSPTLDTLLRICHALSIAAWPLVRRIEREMKSGQKQK